MITEFFVTSAPVPDVVGIAMNFCFQLSMMKEGMAIDSQLVLYLLDWLMPTIAKVLILVGLGKVLGRVMPVIEESKSLV